MARHDQAPGDWLGDRLRFNLLTHADASQQCELRPDSYQQQQQQQQPKVAFGAKLASKIAKSVMYNAPGLIRRPSRLGADTLMRSARKSNTIGDDEAAYVKYE